MALYEDWQSPEVSGMEGVPNVQIFTSPLTFPQKVRNYDVESFLRYFAEYSCVHRFYWLIPDTLQQPRRIHWPGNACLCFRKGSRGYYPLSLWVIPFHLGPHLSHAICTLRCWDLIYGAFWFSSALSERHGSIVPWLGGIMFYCRLLVHMLFTGRTVDRFATVVNGNSNQLHQEGCIKRDGWQMGWELWDVYIFRRISRRNMGAVALPILGKQNLRDCFMKYASFPAFFPHSLQCQLLRAYQKKRIVDPYGLHFSMIPRTYD